jgi:hypothetical protein
MRQISYLSEVQLCASHREINFRFKFIRWPGSRKARIALDRAVGGMHLDHWKYCLQSGPPVTDPIPYFINALAAINRNATNAPGQAVVQQVLSSVFGQTFSTTLDGATFATIHNTLKSELLNALRALGSDVAITPGFEDMLPNPPTGLPVPDPLPKPGPPTGPGGGTPELEALEEALGAAFIDYFNGYAVDDMEEAFQGYGGTDLHIQNALTNTFNPSFAAKLASIDVGGKKASEVTKELATDFGTALSASIADPNYSNVELDPVFTDLKSL